MLLFSFNRWGDCGRESFKFAQLIWGKAEEKNPGRLAPAAIPSVQRGAGIHSPGALNCLALTLQMQTRQKVLRTTWARVTWMVAVANTDGVFSNSNYEETLLFYFIEYSTLWGLLLGGLCGFPGKWASEAGFRSLLYHSRARWPWTTYFCSLGLSFLMCKMGDYDNSHSRDVRNTW